MKNIFNKKTIFTLIATIALLFLIKPIMAHAGFGVSPIGITKHHLKPGAVVTETLSVSRSNADESSRITIEPDLGEIDSWFTFSPDKEFIFEAGAVRKDFQVTIKVPENAELKEYTGIIRIKENPLDENAGVSITKGIRLDVDLVVTNADYPELSILLIKTEDTPKGQPVPILVLGENTGNIDVSPSIKVTVLNLVMEKLEEHDIVNFGFIKPNKKDTLTGKFSHNLPVGEYFMEVKVMLDEKELRRERLVFRVTDEIVPPIAGSVDKDQNIFQKIGSLLSKNQTIIIYTIAPLLVALFVYYIYTKFEKLEEENTKTKKKVDKLEQFIKGSKKVMKATLSFSLGMLTIGLLLSSSEVKNRLKITETEEVGETHGVQDINIKEPTLNVIAPEEIEEKEYHIYKEPDMLSEVLLTVKEGYVIKAAGETTDWYKVELEDRTFGWLHKSSVKTKTVKE